VSVTSITGQIGNRGQANYAVAPGLIATPMSEGAFDRAAIERLVPMQRAGTPNEVAELLAFLASDQASCITGQVIGINGGMA